MCGVGILQLLLWFAILSGPFLTGVNLNLKEANKLHSLQMSLWVHALHHKKFLQLHSHQASIIVVRIFSRCINSSFIEILILPKKWIHSTLNSTSNFSIKKKAAISYIYICVSVEVCWAISKPLNFSLYPMVF